MIFLGCLYDRTKESEYLLRSRVGLCNAANAFQWHLIEGFKDNGETVTIVNALPFGVFPRQYKQLRLKDRVWEHNGEKNYEIGCVNVPFIKQYNRYRRLKEYLRTTTDTEIVFYSTYTPFLRALYRLDKRYTVTAVVADLPAFSDLSNSGCIKRWLRKVNNKKISKYMHRVDKFVLLTEQMKEPLEVGDRPYVIVEGVCDGKLPATTNEQMEKTVLYTGALHRKFGIPTLLEAFSLIKDDAYRLWICGGGDYQKEIEAAAKKDPRITFFGYVTKTQVGELQQKAMMLINPRPDVEEFTKYSFPSKTMEYMLSGKPVIMHKLAGVPDEYDPYLFYIKENTPESVRKAIEAIGDMTAEERNACGAQAAQFVVNNKNAVNQTRKILELLRRS